MSWSEFTGMTLDNEHVQLRPLAAADREPLREIAMDADIWRYFITRVETDEDFDAFFDAALADQRAGGGWSTTSPTRPSGARAGSMSLAICPNRTDGWRSAGPGWARRSAARASTGGRSS